MSLHSVGVSRRLRLSPVSPPPASPFPSSRSRPAVPTAFRPDDDPPPPLPSQAREELARSDGVVRTRGHPRPRPRSSTTTACSAARVLGASPAGALSQTERRGRGPRPGRHPRVVRHDEASGTAPPETLRAAGSPASAPPRRAPPRRGRPGAAGGAERRARARRRRARSAMASPRSSSPHGGRRTPPRSRPSAS